MVLEGIWLGWRTRPQEEFGVKSTSSWWAAHGGEKWPYGSGPGSSRCG